MDPSCWSFGRKRHALLVNSIPKGRGGSGFSPPVVPETLIGPWGCKPTSGTGVISVTRTF